MKTLAYLIGNNILWMIAAGLVVKAMEIVSLLL